MVPNKANSTVKRKRKVVSDNERKRAIYSCDRCKRMKIACKRLEAQRIIYDKNTPCIECVSSGVECLTTAPRKKRSYFSMSETSRYQLKCLIQLFKSAYPDKDPNNFDHLMQIANQLHTNLPPNTSETISNVSEGNNGTQCDPELGLSVDEEISTSKGQTPNIDTAFVNGLNGTPGIMKALLDLLKSGSLTDIENNEDKSSRAIYPVDIHTDNQSTDLQLLNSRTFPLVDLISKENADKYVDLFFRDIHPGYFIFNEANFRIKYETLFREIGTIRDIQTQTFEFSSKLRKEEICYIYLVWLLGIKNHEYITANESIKVAKVYLNIVKLLMGDIVINPTLEGIRLLYMAALYFETQKKRENSWLLYSLALQQCVSLGFHRKSAISKYSEAIQDEIKTLWWSIFRIHMNSNSYLGRFPTIALESVDIGLPKLLCIQDTLFQIYYCSSVELFKIMYMILKHRKKLFVTNDPMAPENTNQLIKIQGKLNSWYQSLPPDLAQYSNQPVKRYRVKLHLQYHYLFISLILPYLLFISRKINDIDIKKHKSLIHVLCQGIKSAEELCQVIEYSYKMGFSVGLLNYDLFYAYYSIMVLLLANVLLVSKKITYTSNSYLLREMLENELQVNQDSILSAISKIHRMVNTTTFQSPNGYMKECNDNIKLLLKKFGIAKSIDHKEEIKSSAFSYPIVTNSLDDIISLSPANAVVFGLDPTVFEMNNHNTNANMFNFGTGFSQFERSNFIFNDKYFIDPSLNDFENQFAFK